MGLIGQFSIAMLVFHFVMTGGSKAPSGPDWGANGGDPNCPLGLCAPKWRRDRSWYKDGLKDHHNISQSSYLACSFFANERYPALCPPRSSPEHWTPGMGKALHSYALVISYIAIENGPFNSGFTHCKWWFSIVVLVCQRVSDYLPIEHGDFQ